LYGFLKWVSVRVTSEADMEGRLLRKIAILKSAGGVKGEGFVVNDKFGPKWDGRDVPQCSKKA